MFSFGLKKDFIEKYENQNKMLIGKNFYKLKNKQNSKYYAAEIIPSQSDYNNYFVLFSDFLNNINLGKNSNHIVKFYEAFFWTERNENKDDYFLILIFELCEISLYQEILFRNSIENKNFFEEDQIDTFANQLILGYLS